jgi:Na+/proline symporter
MVDLSGLDFILIGAYFFVLLVIGYASSRKQKEEDYLIGDRKLGSFSTMMTMNASKSGSILMIFVALIYLWGFSALWYFIGVVTGSILFIPFALKLKDHSRGRFYTLADYFKHNYGTRAAVFASIISTLFMIGILILNLIAGAKIFAFFTGWPFWLCSTVMMLIVLTYLLMGGFKAVIKTDILQYTAMIFILVMLTFVIFNSSVIPASDWNFFKADIVTIVGFFLVGILFAFSSPDMWRRVYSSKGKKELKKGLVWATILYAILAFFLVLVSLTIKAKFPSVDPDLALLYGFANILPNGLLGLSAILLFAAIMSSVDTYIFTSASAVVQDFFDFDKKLIIKNIKRAIFVLAVVGTLVSILIQNLIIGSYLFVALASILGAVVIWTWIKKRTRQRTLIIGFIFGILGLLFYLIKSLSEGEINPMMVIFTLVFTIVGLVVGGFISWIKK